MEQSTLESFESLCTQDASPACQSNCPIQVEAAMVIAHLAQGRVDEARKSLERHMPLAGLCGWLCEGPCLPACLRGRLNEPVDIPLLERHAVSAGRGTKPFPMPQTKHRAALVGSGLSALVCAQGLAIKGHKAMVFHSGPIGATLNDLPPGTLPPRALAEAIELLEYLKVGFRETEGGPPDPAGLLADHGAVFLALDDPWAAPLAPAGGAADPVTRGSGTDGIFLGPGATETGRVEAMSAGKKAAASIDRLFQGVNPASAREREAVGPSRLAVDLGGQASAPKAAMSEPPTAAEAQAEAGRCLACSCLKCLAPCPFLRSRKGYPKKYAREFYNNIITAFGIRHANRHINSCAECGLCGQICPNGADMGKFVGLARADMVASSHMPVSAHEFALEDQEHANSPGISFVRPAPGRDRADYLFFPGCQLLGAYPGTALAAYRYLNGALGGSVGLWSGCCGAPGRWSGRGRLTARATESFRALWRQSGGGAVILACPSCASFFAAELPDVPALGLWPLLDTLPPPPGATAIAVAMVVHDPCSARLDAEGQRAVRSMAAKIGQKTIEPRMTGRHTLCCGFGGLASEANPDMGREYALERTRESPGPILAWCSVCRDRFLAEGHPSLHPLDLLFPPADIGARLGSRPPGLSARREGRALFRDLALGTVWLENPPKEKTMPPNVDIPGEVLADMESRRILAADVAATLEVAKKNGPVFANPETGRLIASHRPRQVTFWVEYEERPDGTLLVHRAWCHRMVVPGVPGEGAESPASLEGYARTGGRV
ncbi:MAG: 4Fe-4S dicluster domain-containing protein [Deltaproteobacteria bacterium]|jgi:Fe-S oxidoreductase|nr:4Fe-4S dicluster domain-containing protein [Deltaproteobacteria bacterium]